MGSQNTSAIEPQSKSFPVTRASDVPAIKIAIITPAVIRNDGQGRVNFEIISRLLNHGFDFHLVVMRMDATLAEQTNVKVWRVPIAGMPALIKIPLFLVASYLWLLKNRAKFDVVQIDGASTIAVSDLNPAHFVHSAWRTSGIRNNSRPLWHRLYHRLLSILNVNAETAAYKKARAIAAVSRTVRNELVDLGIDPEIIEVVPLGVDTESYFPGVGDRDKYCLPKERFVILFAGDMATPRKNLDAVLQATARIPAVHLAVVGSLERNPYPELAKQMGINDRVTFLGFRDDMPEIFRCADAFIFPSRYEPFGLVVLEALASGVPVISARTTGASDVITEECGFVVENPEDVDSIVIAIERLIAEPALCCSMRTSSRTVALKYTWDGVAMRFAEMYSRAATLKIPARGQRS